MSQQDFQGMDRETLGRVVRAAWTAWAHGSGQTKEDWFLSWEEMSEEHREADRQIGEAVAKHIAAQDARGPALNDCVRDRDNPALLGVLTEGPQSWFDTQRTSSRIYARVRWNNGLLEWVPYAQLEKVGVER